MPPPETTEDDDMLGTSGVSTPVGTTEAAEGVLPGPMCVSTEEARVDTTPDSSRPTRVVGDTEGILSGGAGGEDSWSRGGRGVGEATTGATPVADR